MTRLESHQRKVFTRRIAFFVVALILLAIFIYTIGFKLLINGSLYFSGIGKQPAVQSQAKQPDFYGTVTLDTLPNATNSAQIIVSGTLNNFNSLDFYINSSKVETLTDISDDTFAKIIGNLKKGDNTIFVKAKTKDGKNTKTTDTVKVTYKADKPKLEISEPADNSKTSKTEIKIAGTTDENMSVKVNDFPVVVSGQGSFSTTVRLKDVENKISISAADDAGNTEQKTLTVTYQKDE